MIIIARLFLEPILISSHEDLHFWALQVRSIFSFTQKTIDCLWIRVGGFRSAKKTGINSAAQATSEVTTFFVDLRIFCFFFCDCCVETKVVVSRSHLNKC